MHSRNANASSYETENIVRKMVQTLAGATGYNVIAIPFVAGVLAGAGILLNPAPGGVLMLAPPLIVAINLRMFTVKR